MNILQEKLIKIILFIKIMAMLVAIGKPSNHKKNYFEKELLKALLSQHEKLWTKFRSLHSGNVKPPRFNDFKGE